MAACRIENNPVSIYQAPTVCRAVLGTRRCRDTGVTDETIAALASAINQIEFVMRAEANQV